MEADMSNLTLCGCDEELTRALTDTSKRGGLSVNRLILETLRETLIGKGKKPRRYNDLDALAGTWTVAEAAEFDQSVIGFEETDEELWKR
jgi:hypothetical protein